VLTSLWAAGDCKIARQFTLLEIGTAFRPPGGTEQISNLHTFGKGIAAGVDDFASYVHTRRVHAAKAAVHNDPVTWLREDVFKGIVIKDGGKIHI
jgi:hypothetical protein